MGTSLLRIGTQEVIVMRSWIAISDLLVTIVLHLIARRQHHLRQLRSKQLRLQIYTSFDSPFQAGPWNLMVFGIAHIGGNRWKIL